MEEFLSGCPRIGHQNQYRLPEGMAAFLKVPDGPLPTAYRANSSQLSRPWEGQTLRFPNVADGDTEGREIAMLFAAQLRAKAQQYKQSQNNLAAKKVSFSVRDRRYAQVDDLSRFLTEAILVPALTVSTAQPRTRHELSALLAEVGSFSPKGEHAGYREGSTLAVVRFCGSLQAVILLHNDGTGAFGDPRLRAVAVPVADPSEWASNSFYKNRSPLACPPQFDRRVWDAILSKELECPPYWNADWHLQQEKKVEVETETVKIETPTKTVEQTVTTTTETTTTTAVPIPTVRAIRFR